MNITLDNVTSVCAHLGMNYINFVTRLIDSGHVVKSHTTTYTKYLQMRKKSMNYIYMPLFENGSVIDFLTVDASSATLDTQIPTLQNEQPLLNNERKHIKDIKQLKAYYRSMLILVAVIGIIIVL